MDTWGLLSVMSAMYPYMSKLSKAVLTRCFFPETNSKRTWKWMVGRRSLPFGARSPGYVVWNPRFCCECRGARFGIESFQGEFLLPPRTQKIMRLVLSFHVFPLFSRFFPRNSGRVVAWKKQLQEQGSLNYLFSGDQTMQIKANFERFPL